MRRPPVSRWSGIIAGACAGATFGVLMTADAQIIVDPDLPPSMLDGSGLVEALREREAALEARAAEMEARELALAEQREQLVGDLESLQGVDGEAEATMETGDTEPSDPAAAQSDAAPAISDEELEAARLARMDTLSRRVQAMSPAAAAAMLTSMDAQLATEVLSTISARNSGKIMEQLAPNVAARFGALMVAAPEEGI